MGMGEQIESTFNTEHDPGAYDREATAFMVAAGSSDGATVETLRVLLELGADPTRVIESRSAATFACEGLSCWYRAGGDAARLRFVIDAGSPLPPHPGRANRLLCNTAATGDPDRLRILLERGLNAAGHWDPVRARESHRKMMEHMAEFRASRPDPFASLSEELRASMAETARKMEAQELEQYSSAPASNEIPLFCAAESGSAECVRMLLAAGGNAKARDCSKRTALYHAASGEVVRTLLEAGLSLNDADGYGWSPLDSAVNDGESALPRIRAFIEAGADVNATHDHGYTVFMSAVGSGRHPDVLRLLIESGANPHAVSEYGYNAFHSAIDVNFEANAEESVRGTLTYLKELGVDINHRNKGDQTPLARAIERGTGIETKVLCELGADANAMCPVHQCGGGECARIDRPLLFHAADSAVEADIKTEALLKAGADPLAADSDGFTPLTHAVASLCSNAPDYDAAFDAFYKGLGGLRRGGKPLPSSRDEFVAEAMPALRTYVEQFASDIPIAQDSEFAAEWRVQKIACIASLCAYEGWARHEKRRLSAR